MKILLAYLSCTPMLVSSGANYGFFVGFQTVLEYSTEQPWHIQVTVAKVVLYEELKKPLTSSVSEHSLYVLLRGFTAA